MRIQRVQRRSNTFGWCGCLAFVAAVALVVGVAAVFILGPQIPGLALRLAGFRELGNAANVMTNRPAQPEITLTNPSVLPDSSLYLGSLGEQMLSEIGVSAAVGDSSIGRAATVTLTEANLMDLCRRRSAICGGGNDQYRNARIDLRLGGAVIYGDVYIPDVGLWQSLGVVVQVDSSGRQVQVLGVEVGGTLYSLPAGTISQRVNEVTRQVNSALAQLSLGGAGGQYSLATIQVNENAMMIVLR